MVKRQNAMKIELTENELELLSEAIRAQEARTCAEIRVCISRRFVWRPERYAWRLFDRMGMRNTRERNGALIVMMPRVRKVVILGDSGIDALVPPGYWEAAVALMIRHLKDGGLLIALQEGLHVLGDTLSAHWPRKSDDAQELTDEILMD